MKYRLKHKNDFEDLNSNKIQLKLSNGEILTISENSFGEVVVNSTNDDEKMFVQPQASNEFLLKFLAV